MKKDSHHFRFEFRDHNSATSGLVAASGLGGIMALCFIVLIFAGLFLVFVK